MAKVTGRDKKLRAREDSGSENENSSLSESEESPRKKSRKETKHKPSKNNVKPDKDNAKPDNAKADKSKLVRIFESKQAPTEGTREASLGITGFCLLIYSIILR